MSGYNDNCTISIDSYEVVFGFIKENCTPVFTELTMFILKLLIGS